MSILKRVEVCIQLCDMLKLWVGSGVLVAKGVECGGTGVLNG